MKLIYRVLLLGAMMLSCCCGRTRYRWVLFFHWRLRD